MKIHPLTYYLTATSLLITLVVSCPPSETETIIDISPVPTSVLPTESLESPESLQAKVALAKHLKQEGATMYSVYWCGYCRRQLTLFGEEAASFLNDVECDPNGENPRSGLCRQNNVTAYPTWQIKGQLYRGLQSLDELADLSGYQGIRSWE